MTSTAPDSPNVERFGILVSRDLFFCSKVTGTAGQLGLHVVSSGNIEHALTRAREPACCCVLIDLGFVGVEPARFVDQRTADSSPVIVAFGAHVHEAQLEAARNAGCDDVMPRSRFSATLPRLLQECFGAS